MANPIFQIEAVIAYDGHKYPEFILTGHTMNFRLPEAMPEMEFLPFGGLTVDAPIPHGASGRGIFWIIATDREVPFLVGGANFMLYSGGEAVARGTISEIKLASS